MVSRIWYKSSHCHTTYKILHTKYSTSGFTLVETLLAVSLLCVAITAPMLLTVQALSSAYYARDQITAYYLAQEGIEAVHAIRDGQILQIALTSSDTAGDIKLFGALEDEGFADGSAFTIDITNGDVDACGGECPRLRSDGTLYGYDSDWDQTIFTRTMTICYVQIDNTCNDNTTDEVRIKVTVSWRTGSYAERRVELSEDLYRWVQDGSAT